MMADPSNEEWTPTEPWVISHHRKGRLIGSPNYWNIKKHDFPDPPYEGYLEEEWGVYPTGDEGGPIALVAGEENARLIGATPGLLKACKFALVAASQMPKPALGEIDWPRIAAELEAAIAKTTAAQTESMP